MVFSKLNGFFLLILCYCRLSDGQSKHDIRGGYGRETHVNNACRVDMFECHTGGCIHLSDVCNGSPQCCDGSDESPTTCNCGRVDNSIISQRFGSEFRKVKPGTHPWHVGIYKESEDNINLMCSGALIYDDIVLTAAYCFYNEETSREISLEGIHISAGKMRQKYIIEELYEQKFDVSGVVILSSYAGFVKHYHNNLAIVKLKQKIRRNAYVSPICLWMSKALTEDIKIATIAGWNLQIDANSKHKLGEAKANLITLMDCLTYYNDPSKPIITSDKFCLTFDDGVDLVDEDVGAGVTVFHEGRYYLTGVLNARVAGESSYSIATNIYKHLSWIQNTTFSLKEYDSSIENGCSIPDSKVINQEFHLVKCGDSSGCNNRYYAPSNSNYSVTCTPGYAYSHPSFKSLEMTCIDGEWIPPMNENSCLNLCKGLDYKSLDLKCSYLGDKVSCKELRPGTIIEAKCKDHFKQKNNDHFIETTSCKTDGLIRNELSQCIPVCGVAYDSAGVQLLKWMGKDTNHPKYPWHTAIYRKRQLNDGTIDYEYKCEGTLIDTNKVLTAGHCVWDSQRNAFEDASDLFIAIGRLHSHWWTEESSEQKARVAKVIPHAYYNGSVSSHTYDIAVIILSRDLKLSNFTLPACLDLDSANGGMPKGQLGHIIGWGSKRNKQNRLPSKLLESAWVTQVPKETCKKGFANTVSDVDTLLLDKFCILYISDHKMRVGDSGGGLTFTHENLHYVYGVVSISQADNDLSAFTNVQSHAEWLKFILKTY